MTRLRRGPFVYLTLALVCLQLVPTVAARQQAKQWSARLDTVLNGPDYRQSHWGILVTDARTGEVVYSHNADRMLLPASVTKLFSVAAALCLLGVDFLFETPVYARGTVKDGRLKGDLILVASGDVTLGGRTDAQGKLVFRDKDHTYASAGSTTDCLTDTDPLAGLKALAKQVAAHGIKHVEGDVLIDERLFERSKSSGSGPTIVTPIVVNDNVIDVIVTPAAKAGAAAQVRMRPETDFVRMDAQVQTVAGAASKIEIKALGGDRFTVRGQIGVKAKPQVRIYHVEDPAAFARALFIDALRQQGVTVAASALQAPRADLPEPASYAKLERVALYKSPPFAEVAKVTLKVSHNLYASTLPLLVAAKHGKRHADGRPAAAARLFEEAGRGHEDDLVRRRRGRRRGGLRNGAGDRAAVAGDGQAAGVQGVRGGAAGAGRGWHPGGRGRAQQPGARPGEGEDRHVCLAGFAQRPRAADEQGAGRHHDDRARPTAELRDVRQSGAAATGRDTGARGPCARAAVRDHSPARAVDPVSCGRATT